MVSEIVTGIVGSFLYISRDIVTDVYFDNKSSIVPGIMFIMMSVFCHCDAELRANNKIRSKRRSL